MSDKALTNAELELTQKIQMHFPRGSVSPKVLGFWNSCSKELLSAHLAEVFGKVPEPAPKFSLLVDLGTVTVPDGYDHTTRLASFKAKYQNDETKSFYYYNNAITDENFPNPSRILKSGDKLWVRAFQQVSGGTTTSVERMAFLDTQKAIHTGAQGASLVWEQKRDRLPKGKWYASFDDEERLWQDADGNHRVPLVDAYSVGGFRFILGNLEGVWDKFNAFLCFCDLPT